MINRMVVHDDQYPMTNIFRHMVIKVHFDMTLTFELKDHMHFIPSGWFFEDHIKMYCKI